ncbi:hypothetical protein PF003_g1018 [Phytophthora fragariae]|nr:hypothetical protein PF003_g1018 [Phytophthora fragariae]
MHMSTFLCLKKSLTTSIASTTAHMGALTALKVRVCACICHIASQDVKHEFLHLFIAMQMATCTSRQETR